ncbi:MAG: NAD(P)H-binding protein [Dehalococcoidia bacterium]
MPRVLVTGGTGVLGRELVKRLAPAAETTVRISSRRPRRDSDPDVEWTQVNLETGEGLAEAVSGVDSVLHCASSPFRRTKTVDVEGTDKLLAAAKTAGVSHFLYISIVGIDRIPLPYYKNKLATESAVAAGGVPWSIFRATQFHTLIDMFLHGLARFPLALLPTGFRFQPIDPGEVADRMLEHLGNGPAGRVTDLGGPQTRTLADLGRAWAKARAVRRLYIPMPLFGKVASGFRKAYNCTEDGERGRITWEEWLATRYRKETP